LRAFARAYTEINLGGGGANMRQIGGPRVGAKFKI